MGFIQAVQKDLQQSLADQQHIALLHVLRERSATITFDDIRQLLASSLGKRLGPLRLAEVLGGTPGPAPKAVSQSTKVAAKPTPKTKKTKKKSAKPKRRAAGGAGAKEQAGPSAAVPEPAPTSSKKKPKGVKKAPRAKGPTRKAGAAKTNRRPPGLSAEQAEQLASYTEQVYAQLNASGDWIGASELRDHVGGTGDQLRLALKKLESRGSVVRTGERINTRYKSVQK